MPGTALQAQPMIGANTQQLANPEELPLRLGWPNHKVLYWPQMN